MKSMSEYPAMWPPLTTEPCSTTAMSRRSPKTPWHARTNDSMSGSTRSGSGSVITHSSGGLPTRPVAARCEQHDELRAHRPEFAHETRELRLETRGAFGAHVAPGRRSRQFRPLSSAGSAFSSSKAACSARTASATRSSAMMQVIRISEVEMSSMLMLASVRARNMRAA
jgi:hypothetical protein